MKIGDVELRDRALFLAPMEDVTDPSFRYMCKRFGADMVTTEFISSDGLIRDARKSLAKLDITDFERPVGIQIYGNQIEPMVEAAKIAEGANPDVIDINFGCPMKKIAGRGAGSGMMRDVPLMVEMTRQIVNAVKKPVLTEKLKNSNSTKILFVGRLVYYKGVKVLISAMEKVKNAELFIIGSGELEDELKMQAVKLGLQDEVHFMGRVDTETLLSAFSDCDVFVLPSISRAECFGLVQLEAMVYGKPVINTALPTAVPEVSLDGVTGITVKPEDADELAGAIQKLSDDKALRERYGAEAEKRCKEKFSLQQMEDSLFASYLELLGK